MALFDQIATAPPAPVPPSPTERAGQIATEIKGFSVQSLREFVQRINAAFDALWNNTEPNITAALIAEALGTDAVELFAQHAAVRAFLIAQVPSLAEVLKAPPEWANIDFELAEGVPTGRVIITQKPQQ